MLYGYRELSKVLPVVMWKESISHELGYLSKQISKQGVEGSYRSCCLQ